MFDAFLSECLEHFQDLSVSKKRERDHSTAAGAVDQDDDLTVVMSPIVAHIVLHDPRTKEKETRTILYSAICLFPSQPSLIRKWPVLVMSVAEVTIIVLATTFAADHVVLSWNRCTLDVLIRFWKKGCSRGSPMKPQQLPCKCSWSFLYTPHSHYQPEMDQRIWLPFPKRFKQAISGSMFESEAEPLKLRLCILQLPMAKKQWLRWLFSKTTWTHPDMDSRCAPGPAESCRLCRSDCSSGQGAGMSWEICAKCCTRLLLEAKSKFLSQSLRQTGEAIRKGCTNNSLSCSFLIGAGWLFRMALLHCTAQHFEAIRRVHWARVYQETSTSS